MVVLIAFPLLTSPETPVYILIAGIVIFIMLSVLLVWVFQNHIFPYIIDSLRSLNSKNSKNSVESEEKVQTNTNDKTN